MKKLKSRPVSQKSPEGARVRRTAPKVYYSLLASPLGLIGVAADQQGIFRISLNERSFNSFRDRIRKEYAHAILRRDKHFHSLSVKFRRYFSGQGLGSGNRIKLQQGTRFQQRVWRALQAIPYGQTRSYQFIAKSIGHPQSSRAVGNACGKNPLPILIPCHRVVKSDGQLGGFTGGLGLKRRLLALEAIRPPTQTPSLSLSRK